MEIEGAGLNDWSNIVWPSSFCNNWRGSPRSNFDRQPQIWPSFTVLHKSLSMLISLVYTYCTIVATVSKPTLSLVAKTNPQSSKVRYSLVLLRGNKFRPSWLYWYFLMKIGDPQLWWHLFVFGKNLYVCHGGRGWSTTRSIITVQTSHYLSHTLFPMWTSSSSTSCSK